MSSPKWKRPIWTLNSLPFDLLDIIRETIESLEPKAKRNMTLSLRLQKGIDASSVMVKGDAAKLVQVLTNLVVNSINYGKAGGPYGNPVLRCGGFHTWSRSQTPGIGIKRRRTLPRVFERFYRVDKSRSRHAGVAPGLGLAIVKHIVESHGQTINVRSTYGEGFNLQLHAGEGRFLKRSRTDWPLFSAPMVVGPP